MKRSICNENTGNLTDSKFDLEVCGNAFIAKGDGWEYKGFGSRRIFTQHKKIPSIRIIKTLVKKLTS